MERADSTTRSQQRGGWQVAARVASVTLAAPTTGATRPAHSYRNTSGGETQVDVAGLTPASGFARKVAFDGTGRVLTDTDATGRATHKAWDASDRLVSTTDAAGRKTTSTRPVNLRLLATNIDQPAPTHLRKHLGTDFSPAVT